MSTTVDHIEFRYRRSDVVTAWTTQSLPRGQQSVNLTGAFERGQTYQVEARSVGVNGAASAWVQVTHTIADVSIVPLTPTSLTTASIYYGVYLNWGVDGTQTADVVYEVQRTSDASGAPNASGWVDLITSASSMFYTDNVSDTVTRWYRVRAIDYQGLTSEWCSPASGAALEYTYVPPDEGP